MATVIPLRSLITFLILAWVINFLALQDAAQEQPDDDEHDRNFDQGESPFRSISCG